MGEKCEGNLYTLISGEWSKIGDVKNYPDLDGEEIKTHSIFGDGTGMLLFYPRVQNVSRKRFTKLLMSIGVQRNQANAIAEKEQRRDEAFSYKTAWYYYLILKITELGIFEEETEEITVEDLSSREDNR